MLDLTSENVIDLLTVYFQRLHYRNSIPAAWGLEYSAKKVLVGI